MDATGGDGEARARVERLLRAAARLVDPADPLHAEALAVLPAETGLSREGVELALGCSVERGASDEQLGRLLASVRPAGRVGVVSGTGLVAVASERVCAMPIGIAATVPGQLVVGCGEGALVAIVEAAASE